MPYPAYANYPRRRVPALVSHAQPRPSTPQGSQWGDVRQWAGQVVEKIRVASAAGRVRFLPWYDPYTEETPEIRREYPKMLVESSIKAAFQTKILSVISLPVQFNPVDDDDPRQNEAAEFHRWMFKRMKGGTPGVGWSILHPAIIKGHSVCEKVKPAQPLASGKFRGKVPVTAIKSKDTDYLQLGIDPFRNVTGVRGMAYNAGRVWPPDDFVIFSYLSLFESPAGTSDFRAAYRPYWIKNTTWQLRGLHLDKYVGPYLRGSYTTQDQKDALEAALEQARSTTWLTVPIGTAVDAIDLSMRGTADFEAAIKDCDREMLIAIVGAHLQILEGQTTGGRGNTKVHKETAELIQWWLADRLAQAYYEQVVVPSTEENYWDVEAPEVSVGAVTEEEVLKSLEVYEKMQKLGAKISSREVYKVAGKTKPTEADDVLQPPQPPQQPPAPAGGGPDGAGPFSERVRRFCMEGQNKGLPGVCPEDKQGGTAVADRPSRASIAEGENALRAWVNSGGGSLREVTAQKLESGDLPPGIGALHAQTQEAFRESGIESRDLVRGMSLRREQVMKIISDGSIDFSGAAAWTENDATAKEFMEYFIELNHRHQDVGVVVSVPDVPVGGIIASHDTNEIFSQEANDEGFQNESENVAAVGKVQLVSAFHGRNEVDLEDEDERNDLLDGIKSGEVEDLKLVFAPQSAAHFAAETADFCQEGENKGMPGVCPENKDKPSGNATPPATPVAALPHAFHPANPAAPDAARAAYAGLSPEDAGALKEYSWHAFDDVNKALRGEVPASAETQGHIDRLNALIAKTPDFPAPVTVFRAVRGSKMPGGGKAFVEGLKTAAASGAPVSYRGFASTTTRPELAVNMATESTHGIVFEIAARKGLDLKPYSHLPDEDEVLLPEGAGFKITSVEKRTDPSTQEDYWHVKAEHLPAPSPPAPPLKSMGENAAGGKFVDESPNAWSLPARGKGPGRGAVAQPG